LNKKKAEEEAQTIRALRCEGLWGPWNWMPAIWSGFPRIRDGWVVIKGKQELQKLGSPKD